MIFIALLTLNNRDQVGVKPVKRKSSLVSKKFSLQFRFVFVLNIKCSLKKNNHTDVSLVVLLLPTLNVFWSEEPVNNFESSRREYIQYIYFIYK